MALGTLEASPESPFEDSFEVIAMLAFSAPPPYEEADVLPGLDGTDWRPRQFYWPNVNDRGEVFFMAYDSGGYFGIWKGDSNGVQLVVRSTSPDLDGRGIHDGPQIDRDNATFIGLGYSVWSGSSASTMRPFALADDPAPGGDSFEFFGPPVLLSDGSVVFAAEVDSSTDDEGIYGGTPGNLRMIAREGRGAPGHPAGTTFERFENLVADTRGGYAFDCDTSAGSSVYRGTPGGGLVIVASGGDTAPGTGGKRLGGFSDPSIGADGTVAFTASLFGSGLTTDTASGIWIWKEGSLHLVARGGTPAADTPYVFRRMLRNVIRNAPVADAHGRIAFLVETSGGSGIWFGDEHGIRLVAHGGHAAPGRGGTWKSSFLDRQYVGPSGHVAFTANTDYPDAIASRGLWITDVDGTLLKLVEVGDELMIRGKLRRVTFAKFKIHSLYGDHRMQPINAAGQVAFIVNTDDGHQALIRAQVPFPAAATETAVVRTGNEASLRIRSRPGYSYQLEATETLEEGDWEDIGPSIAGTGDFLTFECPDPPETPDRLFRIRIFPTTGSP